MLKKMSWPVVSLMLTACVTINIYFPAAAAEEAARTIVRDVLSAPSQELKDETGEAQKPPGKDDQSALESASYWLVLTGRLLELGVAEVHAAQVDIKINTAAISKLRASMNKRQRSLSGFYQSGAVGFDQAGRVSVRDASAVPLSQRNQMKKLVADENRDRDALYREVARANKHPEWEQDIRNTFSRIWIEEAPAGYWYKSAAGSWARK